MRFRPRVHFFSTPYFPRLFWYCDMIEVISHKPDSRGEDVKGVGLDQTPAVHRAVVWGCGGHRGTDGREDTEARMVRAGQSRHGIRQSVLGFSNGRRLFGCMMLLFLVSLLFPLKYRYHNPSAWWIQERLCGGLCCATGRPEGKC